jgi:prepilin-type processing-associated H-X9-DG protein
MSLIWTWPNSTLSRVVDGDTFVANVTRALDFGFHVTIQGSAPIKMRLNRINSSPAGTPSGDAATAAATALLQGVLLIETVGPYKYGDEWMAEVTTASGVNVSDAMVTGGNALYWDGHGPRPGG